MIIGSLAPARCSANWFSSPSPVCPKDRKGLPRATEKLTPVRLLRAPPESGFDYCRQAVLRIANDSFAFERVAVNAIGDEAGEQVVTADDAEIARFGRSCVGAASP
jgi:hypothetical protein